MSGHDCISLPPIQSSPGAFFGFRCLISNPTSSLHIGSIKKEFITLSGKYSWYLWPQAGNSAFKTSPIVQKWLFMASDILFWSLMTFPSINNVLIKVDLDPAFGFIMGFRVFHISYTECPGSNNFDLYNRFLCLMLIFKPLVIHGLSLPRCLESCTSGNDCWNIWCTVVTNVWYQSSSLSTYLSFQFSVVIFNKLWTISGTKYPSHRFISCTGITDILERYKTWQVVAYITMEHATQCTYYFFLVRLFHKNMINAGCRKLGDTSRQRYIRQIPVWHHSGHVWYYIFIGVLYKINIHVSSQNDVFPVIKFG